MRLELTVVSVANLTRHDADEFFPNRQAGRRAYPHHDLPARGTNRALDDLRAGKLNGAAVLVP
jgi:propanol-preferring alcohol dehydrogenase